MCCLVSSPHSPPRLWTNGPNLIVSSSTSHDAFPVKSSDDVFWSLTLQCNTHCFLPPACFSVLLSLCSRCLLPLWDAMVAKQLCYLCVFVWLWLQFRLSYSKTGFDGVNVASIKRVYIAEIARHMQCFKWTVCCGNFVVFVVYVVRISVCKLTTHVSTHSWGDLLISPF